MRLFILLLVLVTSSDSIAKDFTFRNTKWGMSIDEVKHSENLKVAQEDNEFLGYKTRVIDKDVLLAYIFVNNKLVRAKYVLADRHTNSNDYLIDYNDFNSILTKKYGDPEEDKTIWRDDLYQDDPTEYPSPARVRTTDHCHNVETCHEAGTDIVNTQKRFSVASVCPFLLAPNIIAVA